FRGPSRLTATPARIKSVSAKVPLRRPRPLKVPSEKELLDICNNGEDQLYEFKGAGTLIQRVTKEIAAMLNTRQGGMIFYGVEDDGTIQGTDTTRQRFDQPLQNSVKNTISPAATVKLHAVSVIGTEILV